MNKRVGQNWRKSRGVLLVLFSILFIASCGDALDKVDPDDLDVQRPFGFSWEVFHGKNLQTGADPSAECRNLISKLGKMIASGESERLENACRAEKYASVYADDDQIPTWLRNGEVSVVVRGDSVPIAYEYHFLHRVIPDDGPVNMLRREWHATNFRAALDKIYGNPDKMGSFDEYSYAGFVASDEGKGPCVAWVEQNVGIVLCSQRAIFVDGIEMALSFIRLDRAPNGQALRCMIGSTPTGSCENDRRTNRDISTETAVKALEILTGWLGPNTFQKCRSDDLESLEEVWALPESEAVKLSPVIEARSANDLATYAINFASESNLSPKLREKVIMFLFNKAASQGSEIAMNEIGASLLYCYQHVRQDVGAAEMWLSKAAARDDPMAMKSLALMRLLKLTEVAEPFDEAVALLEKCTALDRDICSNNFRALNAFLALREE